VATYLKELQKDGSGVAFLADIDDGLPHAVSFSGEVVG